ncbi:hypothetical protein OPT61_g7524 [Boeremia exigua]|uniref:Uncharacterized protein n=1 Tax=Boeremia exigua TaxID=749465 RepID=A0ACC2I2A8_9PLEO|nr:hypothetical protein OPT61_g7524 [Boeremia exigua]
MADVASSVVLGLPGLFVSCVECFEIIQYGRNLESERDHFVLRLHYIGLKLSRWGASKGLVGAGNAETSPIDPALEECRACLESIMSRFADAQKKSRNFELKAEKKGNALEAEEMMMLESESPHREQAFRKTTRTLMNKYATKYRNGVKRAEWALYERKVLENLVISLRADVDDLVELFPERIAIPERTLIEVEVEEIEDDVLPVLQRINDIDIKDEAVNEAVSAEISKRERQGHRFANFDIEGKADLIFRAGDDVGFGAVRSGNSSEYTGFNIRGSGTVNTGDKYHGQAG